MAEIPSEAKAVLDVWFGADGTPERWQPREAWFRKDDAFDASIARQFAPLLETALQGGLADWQAAPQPALARIVLLDQFTRNAFRGTPRAFAGDALAIEAARAMVASGQDMRLAPVARAFVYLPFEHAEDLAAQDESVRLFSALEGTAPEVQGMLDYALRHRAIIERFGRFPHRNAVLGRSTTPEEAEFLLQPGSSF